MNVRTKSEVKGYYQDKYVAEKYIEKRFTEPLNVIEHYKQVSFVNKVIKKYACKNILELAPGPGRITAEVISKKGLAIDSSEEMLKIARKRTNSCGKKWIFRKGDAFNLGFSNKFDLVFTFRFLLHFKKDKREKLYSQIKNSLKKGGYLVFEGMNVSTVRPLRKIMGNSRYFVYDKLYSKKELIRELENNGFQVLKMYPVLNNFFLQAIFSRPFKFLGLKRLAVKSVWFFEVFPLYIYEWVVLCRKK